MDHNNKFSKLFFTLFASLFLITPLLVTPFTDELFEFPKMVFVYLIGSSIILIYLLKIVFEKQLRFKKTPLNLALILIVISSIASTIFSMHIPTSIFGYYSRFNGNLLSILLYIFLAFIMLNEINVSEIKKLIFCLIISSALVSIYAIAQRLGIDKDYWVEHSYERVFATFGQPNWLAAFLVMIIPYTLILALQNFGQTIQASTLNKKLKTGGLFLLLLFTFSLLLLSLIFTRSISGYLALCVSLFILGSYFLIQLILKRKKSRFYLISYFLLLITIASFILISLYPNILNSFRDLFWEKETNQIRLIVWKGTINLIASRPIIGYGLETFAYSFLPFRPQSLNQTTEWNFLFNKPHNEYLEILSESGFMGLIVYLFFITILIIWIYKNWQVLKNRSEIMALFTGFLGLLVTLFFGFQVTVTNLLFFLFPVFIVILSDIKLTVRVIHLTINTKVKLFFYCLLTTVYCLLLILNSRYFLANVFYDIGSVSSLEKAVQYMPFEDTYRRHLAYAYMHKMSENSDNKDKAVNEINKTLKSNDRNYLNLQTLEQTYLELAQVDSKYFEEALKLTEKQLLLCPTDPEVYYTYGLLLMTQDKNEEAKEIFQKALELKPDYENAQKMLDLIIVSPPPVGGWRTEFVEYTLNTANLPSL